MTKLNFAAKHDYEFISNYKVLQETFKRNKVDKVRVFWEGDVGSQRRQLGLKSACVVAHPRRETGQV